LAVAKDPNYSSIQDHIESIDLSLFIRVMSVSSSWLAQFSKSAVVGLFDEELRQLRHIPSLIIHSGDLKDELHDIQTAVRVALLLESYQIKICPRIFKNAKQVHVALATFVNEFLNSANFQSMSVSKL